MLDKQIQILSVDTGNFYSNHELYLHRLNHKIKIERNNLRLKLKEITKQILTELSLSSDFDSGTLDKIIKDGDIDHFISQTPEDSQKFLLDLIVQYKNIDKLIVLKNDKIKNSKDRLLNLLQNKTNENIKSNGRHHIRILTENDVSKKRIISVFESNFTRTINATIDEFTDDFMIIQVYYFEILRDLIHYGFFYNGERYIYFTSSAGQIRTKKVVFIKERIWNAHQKTIMCGLTVDSINAKGGNNTNKHLSYLALFNSATDVWENFDIDKTIVIDDFETNVYGTYDLVDDADYSIKRMLDYVPITHTDGAGMILPNAFGEKQKNFMVRLPWIKGLLGVFDFVGLIEEYNYSPIVRDIYGQEHDVIKEDIQVIFTKSQFKLYKYYESWDDYKLCFKKYGCEAGYTNPEEDRIKDAKINYQMLQTLTDITNEEILEISQSSVDRLNNLCSSVGNIKDAFGITPYNLHKNSFQKSVELYPDLLNDVYVKSQLKGIKDSMVKKYKSGKLEVSGKYTFLLPDFFAACQHWFGDISVPKGLLNDGEVFCWLFRKSEKLDCLRSPHLFMEHAIRNNIAYENCERRDSVRKWFTTNAIYTSSYDLISKVLQFDDH